MGNQFSGLKIIIVAGNDLATKELSESLSGRGARVVIAPDGAAAFEVIEHHPPDFAILDWRSDCDAVTSVLNTLGIPYLYLGTPMKRDRDIVRRHLSAAFADALLTMVNNNANRALAGERSKLRFPEAHPLTELAR